MLVFETHPCHVICVLLITILGGCLYPRCTAAVRIDRQSDSDQIIGVPQIGKSTAFVGLGHSFKLLLLF